MPGIPKIRIVHKGLILVAVPLIFGIAYISLLFYGLQDTSKHIDREFMLKDAMISHFTTLTAGFCGYSGKGMYMGTSDPTWKAYYVGQNKRAVSADKHLRKLLCKEQSLEIPTLAESINTINRTKSCKTPLLRTLQSMSRDEANASKQSIETLRQLLWGGVAAGVTISGVLAIYFCLNITNRLLIIVNNAISLSKGLALNPPFKGTDEIAELDQLLYKSATEIRELERFKKEMVGVVSHELKSPLSSVGSFLSSLGAGVYGELTAKAQEKAIRTGASVKRLMGLVAELLYLDRLELDMNPETIAVDDLISSSVDTVKELSEKSEIDIKVISAPGEVFADRNRILQVIVNLLSNAMKFSPPNGVVTLEAHARDGLFECKISDQGPGIPESFRKQIFEPFKQVDATDSTSKKGTGLGLAISRSIVEQHGGQIGVDSENGKGSTFWFKIPQKLQTDQQKFPAGSGSSNQIIHAGKSGQQSGKFRVLHQGLVIIALPLLLQIGFALSFNNMLNGLCNQLEQEDQSMRILDALNRATDRITGTLEQTLIAVYLPIPTNWKQGEADTLRYLENAVQLSGGNSEQEKDLNSAKQHLKGLSEVLEHEEKTHESKNLFDKLDFNYRKMAHEMYGLKLKPKNQEEMIADALMPDSRVLMESFQALSHDYLHTHLSQFLSLKDFVDRAMDREKLISQRAAKQRSNMLNNLKLTLICAIVSTVVVSTLIALFLLRSISNRLQHIMQNTTRLAKRETLAPALAGYDEIALLDRVLFETGNRLMELETFKRELVSIVSHELRTPLLSISAALELFSTGVHGKFSDKGKNRLKHAQEESDRLVRLINDLLDIEKMEAGKFVLDFSEVKVSALLNSAATSSAQLAEAKQITIELSATDADGSITVDRDRILQVFVNLLSNAIKYSPENGKIIVAAENLNNKRIKFSITDQGRGIPEELRLKIFDRFVQVEKSDATERGGTGLGLAICKAIVEQHGGEIGVDSQVCGGSTFWFMLPIRVATPVVGVENSIYEGCYE